MIQDFVLALESKIASMQPQGAFLGKVITPPPKLTIEYNGEIIPTEQLYINNMLLSGYTRAFDIKNSNIKLDLKNTTQTEEADNHKHNITQITGTGTEDLTGNIKWTDTLVKGQLVLVLPIMNSYIILCNVQQLPNSAGVGA